MCYSNFLWLVTALVTCLSKWSLHTDPAGHYIIQTPLWKSWSTKRNPTTNIILQINRVWHLIFNWRNTIKRAEHWEPGRKVSAWTWYHQGQTAEFQRGVSGEVPGAGRPCHRCLILLLKHFHQQRLYSSLSIQWQPRSVSSLRKCSQRTPVKAKAILSPPEVFYWAGCVKKNESRVMNQGTTSSVTRTGDITFLWSSLHPNRERVGISHLQPPFQSPLPWFLFFPDGNEKGAAQKKVGKSDLVKPSALRVPVGGGGVCEPSRPTTQAVSSPTREAISNKSEKWPQAWQSKSPLSSRLLEMMTVRNQGTISMCAQQGKDEWLHSGLVNHSLLHR